ncbi:TPA: hypothetical protein N0F65_009018 [Lagenidium giganteum]|uniref:Calpain catalytic domain-containing protein n=1 Tax=Lagenidium giganteum TaxID=4803 RepID=A0AAV2YWF7_9STRA|nr:TPA: hypothetical protein N0F65_009018 [Lagenidium giganteum]
MFCGECGHRWAPEEIATARFCAECGAPREDEPAPIPTTSPAVASTSYSAPSTAPVSTGAAPALFASTPAVAAVVPSSSMSSLSRGSSYVSSSGGPTPSPGPVICPSCTAPFDTSGAMFCGECGHPRPVAAAPVDDANGDLFGVSTPSTAYTPPVTQSQPQPQLTSSVSTPYNPPAAYSTPPAAPTPQYGAGAPLVTPVVPSPPMSENDSSPAASITLLGPGAGVSNVSSLLTNMSIKPKSDAERMEREEPDGNGAGVAIRSVTKARNMDSLSTRLQISEAVERNRVQPMERVEGYNVTRVNDLITVVHNERVDPEEDKYYDSRTLPDNGEWLQILRRNRQSSTKFTDPQFPPDANSLYRDPNNKMNPHLEQMVWKWKRVSEFFNETAYVEITMIDDAKKLICSMAIKSPAEAESILAIIKENPTPVDSEFHRIAKEAVTSGLTKRKREQLLLMTKNMITYMSEYVQDGMQRFELMWERSLLEHYRPLAFSGVGDGSAYRVDGYDANMLSKVSVIVPVYFQASGTCLFDRSRESKSTAKVSGVGIEPGELRLGRLADSYLFGALSILSTSPNALAQVFPQLSDDLVVRDRVEIGTVQPQEQQYNDEGVYAVRFWRNNRSRVVVIDDFVPCSQYGKPVFGSFTGSNGKFEIWSMLVEKAYAKLHGGYEAIVGGQEAYCLQDLYGGIPVKFSLQEKCPTEASAWETISRALQSGSLVGCSNETADMELPRGLRKSVAYGVMKLVELDYRGELARLVQLRNSWGTGSVQQPEKWIGSWSNEDPKWHSFSRSQKVDCGFQFREDGTYWMDFSAFYCFFSNIIESRNMYNFKSVPDGMSNPVSPSLSVHVVTGEWNGVSCGGREAMHLNPQYQVFAPTTQGCKLTVHLEQPSRRMRMQQEYPYYIAPVILKNGTKMERKIDISHDVVATGTFISNRSCVLEAALEGTTQDSSRPFVVIPVTYDGNLTEPLGYSLTIFTTKPTAIVPISDTSSLPICCVCQRALTGTFRTFTQTNANGQTQVDRVCKDSCTQIYRDRNTPVCAECQMRIEMVEGRFSGRMYTLNDGACVHAECTDAYRIHMAEKCIHCGHAITQIAGRFDGKYFEVTGGKCHAECMEAYQLGIAKRCVHCSEPVLKIAGRFDGRFYKIEREQLVHFECWDAYQVSVAPKCVHCKQPVVKVPGKFDGRFYELTSGLGKVHFECWDQYHAALLRD